MGCVAPIDTGLHVLMPVEDVRPVCTNKQQDHVTLHNLHCGVYHVSLMPACALQALLSSIMSSAVEPLVISCC